MTYSTFPTPALQNVDKNTYRKHPTSFIWNTNNTEVIHYYFINSIHVCYKVFDIEMIVLEIETL